MVNSVCRNNVPSLVLLKVFAKFNTLKENPKHHKMLNTFTRIIIKYTHYLKQSICDHEYGSTVTKLINSSSFCFNRDMNSNSLK